MMNDIDDLFKELSAPKSGLLEKLAMLPKLGKFASWMPRVVRRPGRLPGSGDG
jgi:4-hydroxy-3-polyprenylbenzoate decarboxylase